MCSGYAVKTAVYHRGLLGDTKRQVTDGEAGQPGVSCSQRTAKDILHYIDHEGRNHICSRRFIQNKPTTGRRRALRILGVQDLQEIPVSSGAKLDFLSEAVAPAVRQPLRQLTKFQKLRQWMLSRKQNEQAPLELTEDG